MKSLFSVVIFLGILFAISCKKKPDDNPATTSPNTSTSYVVKYEAECVCDSFKTISYTGEDNWGISVDLSNYSNKSWSITVITEEDVSIAHLLAKVFPNPSTPPDTVTIKIYVDGVLESEKTSSTGSAELYHSL